MDSRSNHTDRAAGGIVGAFIDDALGLGPHWYDDLEKMRRDYGTRISSIAQAAHDPDIPIDPAWKISFDHGLSCAINSVIPTAYHLAALFPSDFETAVLHAINGAGQIMSRACLTGAPMGAQVGPRVIPTRFIAGLPERQEIIALAHQVADLPIGNYPEDVVAIRALGEPGWLLDGILRHDTFAKEGRLAFMGIPYLAPEGFSELSGFATTTNVPPPIERAGELLALEIQGSPEARDTALLHVPSRTLIPTELVINFGGDEPIWTELLLHAAVGGEHHPGMSRPVKAGVKDEAAFQSSLAAVLSWDFDRVIVGHGDVIEHCGKAKLHTALAAAGFPQN